MKHRLLILLVLMVACFGGRSADAELIDSIVCGSPDYDWWYGCSPTAAGMMMGYYDINGYDGLTYANLVPGGVAEAETFPPSPPATGSSALANNIIASPEHIADFYPGGYGASNDDVPPPFHSFNCLADFMGTSQDSVGNSNGSTKFFIDPSGGKYYDHDAVSQGKQDSDGMYGIGEYVEYAGYDTSNLYTQLTDNDFFEYGFSGGFTFVDYMNEIDNGRVVMLHVDGHSMFGYGYDPNNTVYLHDTWSLGQNSMNWGEAYSSRDMLAVTVLEITGGAIVPEPSVSVAVWSLFCMLGLSYGRYRKRNAA